MKRIDCLRTLVEKRTDQLVVCNLGLAGIQWYGLTKADYAFYFRGSLGMASSFGLGLALALPHRKIWVLDGDGSLALNLSTLLSLADVQPPNLTHFVFVNRRYATCGGQRLVDAERVDFATMAHGAGIENVYSIADLPVFNSRVDHIVGCGAFSFVALEVEPGIEGIAPDQPSTALPPIPWDLIEIKYRFARYVEETEGIKVLVNSFS